MKNNSSLIVQFLNALIPITFFLFTLFNSSCNSPDTKEKRNYRTISDNILKNTKDLLNSGRLRQSDIYLDSAYRAFPQAGPIDLCLKYTHKINFHLNYEFNLVKARLYADSMAAILKDKKEIYKEEYATYIFKVGDILIAEKKYAEAFSHYYQGREFVQKNLDLCNIYSFTNKLGLIKFKQEQYLRAVPYLKRSLIENNLCKSRSDDDDKLSFHQGTLNAIALCFERAGRQDSAVVYYRKALTHIDLMRNKRYATISRGVVYGNLGGAYSVLNKHAEAEKYLKESIRINDRQEHDIPDAQTAKVKLADLYIKQLNLKEAGQLLNELQSYLVKPGMQHINKSLRLKWYQLKWTYFNQLKDTSQAYRYLQKYQAIQDSANRVNEELRNIDMDAVFKDNEQKYRLTLLSKDNELKTGYLAAAIIFLVLVASVLTSVWQNRKRLKRLNVQIRSQNEDMHTTLTALEQSQAENTRMMNIVAHDLRSPMAATVSIANMLLENGNLSAEDREMLELMETSSLHSMEMITDLLNMNTTAEGLKKEPVEMHTLLQYCVNLLKFKASEKKQQITLQAPDITLNVNREKIWRVISNLLVNALKFSPEGSKINVHMQQEPGTVLIGIQDHGIGIPDSLKDKVFNMFTDARRAGTSGEQSFGLGLAISKQIVEAHGGKIWFQSHPDNGTTFFVELPMRMTE